VALFEDVDIRVANFEEAVPFHLVGPGHRAPNTKSLVTNLHGSARIARPDHAFGDRAAGIYVECSLWPSTAVQSQIVFSFSSIHCGSNALASTNIMSALDIS